ncbi:MAG: MaoC family dehydratase [Actinomycetota bacterium]
MRVFEARDRRFGGYFEEYEVADVYRHWPGKTVTQADNHLFCLLTMAASPIHVDEHFMAEEGGIYDKPVVVGSYIYSLMLGMSVPDISGRALANLGTDNLRHIAPVFPGDTIYAETEITVVRASKSRPDAGIITFETRAANQDDVLVASYTRSVLLPRRPDRG